MRLREVKQPLCATSYISSNLTFNSEGPAVKYYNGTETVTAEMAKIPNGRSLLPTITSQTSPLLPVRQIHYPDTKM